MRDTETPILGWMHKCGTPRHQTHCRPMTWKTVDTLCRIEWFRTIFRNNQPSAGYTGYWILTPELISSDQRRILGACFESWHNVRSLRQRSWFTSWHAPNCRRCVTEPPQIDGLQSRLFLIDPALYWQACCYCTCEQKFQLSKCITSRSYHVRRASEKTLDHKFHKNFTPADMKLTSRPAWVPLCLALTSQTLFVNSFMSHRRYRRSFLVEDFRDIGLAFSCRLRRPYEI